MCLMRRDIMLRSIRSPGWSGGKPQTRATVLCGWPTRSTDSCTLPAGVEVLLHSIADRGARLTPALLLVSLLTGASVEGACSKSSSPSSADPPGGPYIGTWIGAVTSDVIGRGTATIVLDGGFKTPSVIQVTGHWSFEFADPTFNANGTVTAGGLPDRTVFVLVFSPSLVPCPAEPNGVSERTRAASLTFTPDRMQGSYVAGGCPGGTMDLVRR